MYADMRVYQDAAKLEMARASRKATESCQAIEVFKTAMWPRSCCFSASVPTNPAKAVPISNLGFQATHWNLEEFS